MRWAGYLNLVPEEEIVHDEADPAESQDGNRQKYLADDTEFGLLEDVKDTPNGDNDTKDVNDLCQVL